MKVLIFDTETSGLEPWLHEMLQLAWQVVDTEDWSVQVQHNCYFPLPKDKRKVSPQAIRVNGLTASVLESKGTMQRAKAIRMFAADMATVDACAAHNLYFDKDFVRVKDTKKLVSWPEECICTMLRTTALCAYLGIGTATISGRGCPNWLTSSEWIPPGSNTTMRWRTWRSPGDA